MANEKKIAVSTFVEAADSDTSDQLISPKSVRKFLNCRVFEKGYKGVVKNIKGNTLIQNSLPDGNNIGIGWGANEETGKLYYFNYNDQGYHGIYCFDILTQSVTPVLLNLIDTNNTDILKFNPDFLINHVDIIQDKLLYWVDGLNKARKTDINRCIDKTSTGYGIVITEDLITAYKQTGVFAPSVIYFTDLTRTSNYLYGLQFKFCYRYYYYNGEISNCSDFSGVPLPPNESYLGQTSITFANNGINVTVETGSKDVVKIEILVKINTADFVSCIVLNKSQLNINSYGYYTFAFYNDGSYIPVDNVKVNRPYSFLPRVPFTQSFVKVAMTYANAKEGFDTVNVVASVAVTFKPFYIPPGSVSQLNNPLFTETLLSTTEHNSAFGFNSWFTTVTHFLVGPDVKKGNVFSITSVGGNGNQYFSYTATVSDTAETVAAQIKQFLRTIDAVGTGTVSNETSVGGDAEWDFTIEAHEGRNAITFRTDVTPVNYSTLVDNGFSINTIKMGSSKKYAIVYDDDDGRTSLAYTENSLLVRTPFETEVMLGQTTPIGLQQPIHTITIYHQPPLWAKYWRLVRTSDTSTFIQLLIQQVNTVTVANQPTYLDLVVGSLFTYQLIHPDTILQYQFERGDRLRLISDENTNPPTLYTPFFETEVLGYFPVVEELVDANITVDGSNQVTPAKTPDKNYIGKYIIINGVERLIVDVDNTGTKFILDFDLTPNVTYQSGSPTTTVYPNYTFKDIRGIIRIKKPPATYNVVNQSLVEIYRPQSNIDNSSYLNFNDFQCKFAITNWGTPQAAHVGNIQSQDGNNPVSTPCIVQVTQGDAYVRDRAMPSNNQNPNPQVIIDQICDPNFSDFYQSNLYGTGRVYPQDQGYGVVNFNQRVRFSNNYIQGTQVNGLNDFDDTDREDYNDRYGSINLSRFRNNNLYLYKALKNTWTPVGQRIIVDNSGNETLTTSDHLLNDLQYAVFDGGIGTNGSSWFEYGDYFYMAFPSSGVFIRTAQNGNIPISSIFKYDDRAREFLGNVSTYGLKVFGGFDQKNDEAIWSYKDFVKYMFNNPFNPGDWTTVTNGYPTGTTWTITQQPANSTSTVVGNQIQITGTNTLGDDFFRFQGNLPGGGTTPVFKYCFTVIADPNRPTAWVADTSTAYCLQSGPNNNGLQGWTVINQIYQDNSSLVGFKMPNIQNISPDAIVPNSATITYNLTTNPTPTGGSNGDIWYNAPSDNLFKNVSGVWSPLSNRVINANYVPPVQNLIACPIPSTVVGNLFVDVFSNTTVNIYAYVDTPGATVPYLQPTYTGQNFYPNYGVAGAANCYELASDLISDPTLKWRFAFNLTKLVTDYPLEPTFRLIIAGRDVAANVLTGSYVERSVGTLIMNGSPGSYQPGYSGGPPIASTGFTSNPMMTGANGTYGIGIGAPILTFTYDVSTNAITLTI